MRIGPYLTLGLLAGFIGLAIPWGNPVGFHGVGIPFASVYWDNNQGTMIDYPNPLAYLLNPLAGLLLGFVIWMAVKLCMKAIKPGKPNKAVQPTSHSTRFLS